MSLTALVSANDASFKLSQKLVSSLAEKFGFKLEDGWATVCSRSMENVQKRLKRERRKNNPAAMVKKPRTAFSFFTQKYRPIVQAANPNAAFGELSRLVSLEWKRLSEAQMAEYKKMEASDKTRYTTERQAALDAAKAAAPAAEVAATTEAAPVAEKKARTPKAKPAAAAAPVAAPAAAAAAPAKATKAPKAAKAAAAPAVAATPAAAPAAAAAPAKATKAAKAAAPAAAATPAPAAATPAPAAATPAKAAKAPKAKAAGKQ